MRIRKSPNYDYLDALIREATSSYPYVNWKPLYVPQSRWQSCLAIAIPLMLSLMLSPPHVMNQCYNKIPIFHKIATLFVDPINRQAYADAQVQNCRDRIKNLFQVHMEDENSLFTITPTLEHRKRPAVFGPRYVNAVSRRASGGAGDARPYTRAQLSEFRDKFLISAASWRASQKLTREHFVPNTATHGPEQYS